jgi:transcriptional regulator with XRE-family HTH domain
VGTARTLRPKRLGEKLATIRQQLQLSQNELIRKLGFGDILLREEISSFERGVRVPPPLVLLEYARLANVYVDDLLDDQKNLPKKLPHSRPHREES